MRTRREVSAAQACSFKTRADDEPATCPQPGPHAASASPPNTECFDQQGTLFEFGRVDGRLYPEASTLPGPLRDSADLVPILRTGDFFLELSVRACHRFETLARIDALGLELSVRACHRFETLARIDALGLELSVRACRRFETLARIDALACHRREAIAQLGHPCLLGGFRLLRSGPSAIHKHALCPQVPDGREDALHVSRLIPQPRQRGQPFDV